MCYYIFISSPVNLFSFCGKDTLMKKKLAFFALILGLLLCLFSACSSCSFGNEKKPDIKTDAEIDLEYTLTENGDAYLVSGIGTVTDTIITIPSSYKNKPVIGIDDYAFEDCNSLISVTISGGITSIGWGAFKDCSNLASVTIPDSVTTISKHTFYCCPSLTSITIPDSVTSIGNCAFYDCSGLTSVTIPKSVISIGEEVFSYCSKLSSITVGKDNPKYHSTNNCLIETASKTLIAGCQNSLIPNDGSVTSISTGAFCGINLVSILIPNSVASISRDAFTYHTGLAFIYFNGTQTEWEAVSKGVSWGATVYCIDDGNTDDVMDMNPYYIPSLKFTLTEDGTGYLVSGIVDKHIDRGISIPLFFSEKPVVGIGDNAFKGCYNLPSIFIPPSVTFIGNGAFSGCYSLTSISLPDSVTSIGNSAFYNCRKLTSISLPDGITSIGDFAFESTGFYNDKSNWQNDVLYIGKNLIEAKTSLSGSYAIRNGTVCIAERAFYECNQLESVTIPDTVAYIGDQAFQNTGYYNKEANWEDDVLYIGSFLIKAKSSLSISYMIRNETICIADNAFYNCSDLKSIIIPNSVAFIGNNAFENCKSLISVFIPQNVRFVGEMAFKNCHDLTSVIISNGVISKAAFQNCTNLLSISIRKNVTSVSNSAFNDTAYYNSEAKWENGVLYIDQHLIRANNSLSGSYEIKNGTVCIADYAFYGCAGLISVSIPDDVTSIGNYAFYNCSELTSVSIPDAATFIGNCAFYNCSELTSVSIPDGVTSINHCTFYNCSGLTTISIPDSVTSIGHCAFYACSNLTAVAISDSIKSIGDYTFYNCGNLQTVTFAPKSQLSFIGEAAFYNCSRLTSFSTPDSVIFIGNDSFYCCSGLTSFSIPDGVTFIGDYTFYGCSGLTSISISKNIASIGKCAFYGCSGLTSIFIPDAVISIGDSAFRYCHGLTAIVIPHKVATIGQNAFFNCSGLTSITVKNKNLVYHSASNCLIETESKTLILGCENSVIPADGSVVSIGMGAFHDCYRLTSIAIPNSVTHIGDYAFRYCCNLTTVFIPDSVTHIGDSAFYNCLRLTAVSIPNSITYISHNTFYRCQSLVSIYFGGTQKQWDAIEKTANWDANTNAYTVYYNETLKPPFTIGLEYSSTNNGDAYFVSGIGTVTDEDIVIAPSYKGKPVIGINYSAFSNCATLTSLTIPNTVTYISDNAFNNCYNLGSIIIPDSVTHIGNAAFNNCFNLDSVIIPDSVICITGNPFSSCTSLTSITVGSKNMNYHSAGNCLIETKSKALITGCKNSVIPTDGSVTSINIRAFEACNITTITIPEGVVYIHAYAFLDCENLSSITIPKSTANIDYNAFYHCFSLESIHFAGTKAEWKAIEKDINWDQETSFYIVYCIDGNIRK